MSIISDEQQALSDFLSRERKVYVATGNTFPHREEFTSWGWHWELERKAWVEDNGSEEDEPCILAIKRLPGVIVTVEEEK